MASAQKGCVTRLQKEYKSLLRVSDTSYHSRSSCSSSSCAAEHACSMQWKPFLGQSLAYITAQSLHGVCGCCLLQMLPHIAAGSAAIKQRIAQQPSCCLVACSCPSVLYRLHMDTLHGCTSVGDDAAQQQSSLQESSSSTSPAQPTTRPPPAYNC